MHNLKLFYETITWTTDTPVATLADQSCLEERQTRLQMPDPSQVVLSDITQSINVLHI